MEEIREDPVQLCMAIMSEWCDRYDVSKTRPSVGSFTKYQWFLFRERNLSLAALKVHRSVIATIVDPLRRTPLSHGQQIFGGSFIIKTTL